MIICPITFDQPVNPVTTPCGHTYERDALEVYRALGLPNSSNCSICSAPIPIAHLPYFGIGVNIALRDARLGAAAPLAQAVRKPGSPSLAYACSSGATALSLAYAAALTLDKRALLDGRVTSKPELRQALFALFRTHEPMLTSQTMIPATMSRASLVDLLLSAAYMTRAEQRGCSGARFIDEIHSRSAFTLGCGEEPAQAREMGVAFNGDRTVRCSDVPLLAPSLASSCATVEESADLERLPWHWHPSLPFVRAPEAYYRSSCRSSSNSSRFEVAFAYDGYPGPPWLYAAPGSGAWWDPRSGNVEAWRFRLRYGSDWETTFIAAAAGKDRRALLTTYNFWFNRFIDARELGKREIDSLLFVRQMTWSGRVKMADIETVHPLVFATHMYNAATDSCVPRERLEKLLFFAPEIVDISVGVESGWQPGPLSNGNQSYYAQQRKLLAKNVMSDPDGNLPH
ncbi:hypothetical protein T492DRAFT_856032 [Pavlovales sp. CCMP2436]|nr:hypothetical protein T492DRAFT_856032 [Pavlovales sp. CCMP2436]